MMIRKLVSALASGGLKGHFGQWGEDILVRKLFPRTMKTGTYLDLGCYHPFSHSNTAYLWLKGWSGVNVDANPYTIEIFKKTRPADRNIWAAIVSERDYESGRREISLRVSAAIGISATGTTDRDLAASRGFQQEVSVPAICISELIRSEMLQSVDYLNVDVEGCDQLIVEDFDSNILAPKVITIEDYSHSLELLLSSSITTKLSARGYSLVGRAGPTSVFLRG
jgi:FkbM family methyltransferase